jgi:hypothetical protein
MHVGHYMFTFLAYILIWIILIITVKVLRRNCPDETYCSDSFGTVLFIGFIMTFLILIPFIGLPIFIIYSFVKLLNIQPYIVSMLLTAILCLVIVPVILPYELVTTLVITSKLTNASK